MALPSTPDQHPPLSAYDEIVEIVVGKENDAKSFFIHKGVLCFYSGYFQGALKGDFREGKDRVVRLETTEPRIFKMFQGWIYDRQIRGLGPSGQAFVDIAKLWIFGDAHLVPFLQNQAIDAYRAKVVEVWSHGAISLHTIYGHTRDGSKLRKFAIDIVGKGTGPGAVHAAYLRDTFPKDALIDLIGVIWKPKEPKWTKEDVKVLDMCEYHVHEEGVRCTSEKKRKAED